MNQPQIDWISDVDDDAIDSHFSRSGWERASDLVMWVCIVAALAAGVYEWAF